MRRVQGCAVIDTGLGVQKISTHAALPLLLLLLVSCGGGGGGFSRPVNLSYPQPSAFVINQAITPLMPAVMGHVTSYAVSPALPTGLALNSDTGVISGTPTAIAAKASYTVRAENLGGSTSAILSITVNDVAPLIAYSSAYYGYTADVTAKTFTPTLAGGAVVTWSVNPALPPGLALSAVDGSVSGMPTAAAAPATYTIIAANSGGQSIATLTIAVAAAPFLDLGPVSLITLIRYANSSVLSQDDNNDNHRWLLQNFCVGTNAGEWRWHGRDPRERLFVVCGPRKRRHDRPDGGRPRGSFCHRRPCTCDHTGTRKGLVVSAGHRR